MKRKRGNSSSLEMLLDTMCNTFGAVVFLCLTLVVLLSVRTSLPPPETPVDETELVRLRKAYAETAEQLALLVRSRRLTVTSGEFLRLELAQSQQRLAQQRRQYEIRKSRAAMEQLRLRQNAVTLTARQREAELKKLLVEEARLEADWKKLEKQAKTAESPQELSFSRREESREEPYFLILSSQGILCRVGLEHAADDLRPSDEVDCRQKGNLYTCSARPGRGRALCLRDGSINPEVWTVLQSLHQQGRFPAFAIARESAAAFFKLRFELKKRQIRFNWSPLSDAGTFRILLTDGPVTWEYAQ